MSRGNEQATATTTHGCNGAPVVAVRYRYGLAGHAARAVHLVTLPVCAGAGAVSALCGALLVGDRIETVEPGEGMPCTMCVLHRSHTRPPPQQPSASPPSEDQGVGSSTAMAGYRASGWPVSSHDERVLLTLGSEATALLIPLGLADRVQTILLARTCPVPVLNHPDAPGYRVFVAGEPYGVPLPWPPSVQVAGGTLPLPPSVTPRGRVRWHSAPDRNGPDTSREIDIFGAVQSRLRDARRRAEVREEDR